MLQHEIHRTSSISERVRLIQNSPEQVKAVDCGKTQLWPLKLSANAPVMDWYPAAQLKVLPGALLKHTYCLREDGLTHIFVTFTDYWIEDGWLLVPDHMPGPANHQLTTGSLFPGDGGVNSTCRSLRFRCRFGIMMQYKTDLGGEKTGNLRVERQSDDLVDGREECMVNFMEMLCGDTQNLFMFRLHYSQAFILTGRL